MKLSEYDIFHIWMKCFYMIALYQIVEDDMSSNTFTECCEKASLLCGRQGWKSINKFTVMKWHQSYRVKELFPNPLNEKAKKERLPPFLREEDICTALRSFCRNNLSTLCAESAIDYVYDNILPNIIAQCVEGEDRDQLPAVWKATEEDKKEVLKQYGLTCLSISTMHRWLGILGFKYATRKKYYFVDGHEKEDTHRDRN